MMSFATRNVQPASGSRYSAAQPMLRFNAVKASRALSSKPGLFGSNGFSRFFGKPAACDARNISLRRSRNRAASSGLAKSDTSTAHRLSYSSHSGLSSSGVSERSSCLFDISHTLSSVCFPKRYNAHPVTSQNKYYEKKPVANQTSGLDTVLSVVVSFINGHLSTVPREVVNQLKTQPTVLDVPRILLFVPLKIHTEVHPTFCGRIYGGHIGTTRQYGNPVDNHCIFGDHNIWRRATPRADHLENLRVTKLSETIQ